MSQAPGTVYLVGGGPGDPDLLTVRGLRLLHEADVVVTDRLGPVSVLDELPESTEVINVGKTPGQPGWTQGAINALLVDRARAGRTVVRLKGGDPFVFGRGGEEHLACRAAGVPVAVVPGVTSALSAPALAGIPATHRGVVRGALVVHGHEPLAPGILAAAASGEVTLVVLMAIARLEEHVAGLVGAGADPQTPAAIVERGSMPDQRVTHAPLALLPERAAQVGVRAPAVVVVGAVAAPGFLEDQGLAGLGVVVA